MGTSALAPGIWMWLRLPSSEKTPTSSHEMVRSIWPQSRSGMPCQATRTPLSERARALYLNEPNLGTRPVRSSSRWWLYCLVKGRRKRFLLLRGGMLVGVG